MAYKPTAEEVRNFVRAARKIERIMVGRGGVDPTLPAFAQAKIDDILAAATPLRVVEPITLQIPALPRPTLAELRKEFSWIREEHGIERDKSPTEALTLKLGTILRADEERIGGVEYERRLVTKLDIVLGYQQARWIVEHQDAFPEFMALLGKVYIDFPGLVVVDAGGYRRFPYLDAGGGRWHLSWAGLGLSSFGRVASK